MPADNAARVTQSRRLGTVFRGAAIALGIGVALYLAIAGALHVLVSLAAAAAPDRPLASSVHVTGSADSSVDVCRAQPSRPFDPALDD